MGKYFTTGELTASATAKRLGIDNTPGKDALRCMEDLISNVLDPLRSRVGEAVIVNSGYRCPRLNKAVGGAATSQHVLGQAADITLRDKRQNRKLWDAAVALGVYDQLIWEKGCDRYPDWVHISYRQPLRRQKLRIR